VKGMTPTLHHRQRGLSLWHVLLLVAVAVSLVVCSNKGNLVGIGSFGNIPNKLGDMGVNIPKLGNSGNGGSSSSNQSANTGSQDYLNPPKHYSDDLIQVSYNTPGYDQQYPPNLETGFYTIQVFSGYNSQHAYDLSRSLHSDGYQSYVEQAANNNGILFKVRIGKYRNRSSAFAVRDKIAARYTRLADSFVVLKQ